jgi:hypothetical protein
MKSQIFRIIFSIVCLIAINACAEQTRITNADLERNRRLWQESKIVDYNFEIRKDYGNWMPSSIQVKNGQVVSKQPAREKEAIDIIEELEDFETIEKAFDSIQKFYNEGCRVEVKYSKEFGYPETILYECRKAATDSVFIITISKFEIIKSD